jgi:lipoprotein NlpI
MKVAEYNPRDPQGVNIAHGIIMLADSNLRLGHHAEAIEAFDRLERLASLPPRLLLNRSFANLYLGRGEAAASNARAALRLAGWRDISSPYSVLLAHFGNRQAKRDDEARKILDEATTQIDANAWPNVVLRYLRREITAQNLLTAAMNNDQMTEARAYLGMDLALSGKKEEALGHLTWVKEYGNRTFLEYVMAVTELKRLEGNTPKQ